MSYICQSQTKSSDIDIFLTKFHSFPLSRGKKWEFDTRLEFASRGSTSTPNGLPHFCTLRTYIALKEMRKRYKIHCGGEKTTPNNKRFDAMRLESD